MSVEELWRRGQEGFPRSFPIVQFPNLPLLLAFSGWGVAAAAQGAAHDAGRAVFTIGLGVLGVAGGGRRGQLVPARDRGRGARLDRRRPQRRALNGPGVSSDPSPLSIARFPNVPPSGAHYESFYLKAADPRRRRAVWIRYTVLKRPGEEARASLWCTIWPEDESPLATKLTVGASELRTGEGELIGIGESRMDDGRVVGRANDARWDLAITAGAPALSYLPSGWMYRAPIPRTKAVSLHPSALCAGEVELAGQLLRFEDWPAMLGHNWGSEHAEEWVWLHGAGFPEAPDAWLDVTIGRVRIGRFVLPWIANGALALDGRRHRLGALGRCAPRASAPSPPRATSCWGDRACASAGVPPPAPSSSSAGPTPIQRAAGISPQLLGGIA